VTAVDANALTGGYRDGAYSRNVFLVLGKYVERQDENLLTQALVLLFNRVDAFRRAFCEQLIERAQTFDLNADDLIAHSQVGRRIYNGRVFVDMEISTEGADSPLFLIESKLDATLGPQQLKNYRSALKRLKKNTRLVILTRGGIDESMWKYTPRRTIWLSWPMVAEIASLSARRASRLDQLLIRDFLYMTRLKGITTVPRMTTDSFGRLAMFSLFANDKSDRLNHKSIAAVDLALQRLIEHRDSALESLFAASGVWRPYQSIYKENGHTVLQAGFWRPGPRRNIQQSYIGLELICESKPRLAFVAGRQLGRNHADYKSDDGYKVSTIRLSARQTRRLFKLTTLEATKELEAVMRRRAKAFLRSKLA
jgi:hypothetical protein